MASLLEESLADIIKRSKSREIKWLKVAENTYRWDREDLTKNTKISTTIQLRQVAQAMPGLGRSVKNSLRLVFSGALDGKSVSTVIDDSDPVVAPLLLQIFDVAKDASRDEIGSVIANMIGYKKS